MDRMEGRVKGLVDYLDQITATGQVTPEMSRLAWDAWNALSAAIGALPVPDAGPGPDGELLYTWDIGEHHFELELFLDRPAEFFYENRVSRELWECEYVVGEPLPSEALARLRLFA